MKGVMKVEQGVGHVEIRELDEPSTPPGHVKIEIQAAGICGTDLHIYYGEFKSRPPVVLGHEIVGQVAHVGSGVENVRVGDRVTSETYFYTCGKCRFCRMGRTNLCPERRSIGSAVNGGFTRDISVPAGNGHTRPDNVSFLAGALTEPLACVVHGALDMPKITPGDVAVIAGPGAIGLLTLQVVKASGATVVLLGTDADEHRLDLGAKLGADYIFDVQQDGYKESIAELTNGYGADIVFECSGAGPAAQMLLEVVRRAGQYAQIGLFGKPAAWDLDQICYKELSVTGTNASVPSAWDRALKLMGSGLVKTEPLISGVLPITEWREAFDLFEKRQGLKIVLQPAD